MKWHDTPRSSATGLSGGAAAGVSGGKATVTARRSRPRRSARLGLAHAGQRQLVGAAAPALAGVADHLECDGLVSAGVFGEGAAGMEAAAGGELAGLGYLAGQQRRASRRRAGARRGGQQGRRVRMEGTGEELGRGRLLDHLPGVHHGDLVGQLGDQGQVVGDEEHRQVHVLAQLLQQLDDLGLDRHVECRRRLVGDEQARLAAERHGDHHPLAHASRELVRVGRQPPGGVGDVHALEQLDSPRPGRGPAHLLV